VTARPGNPYKTVTAAARRVVVRSAVPAARPVKVEVEEERKTVLAVRRVVMVPEVVPAARRVAVAAAGAVVAAAVAAAAAEVAAAQPQHPNHDGGPTVCALRQHQPPVAVVKQAAPREER